MKAHIGIDNGITGSLAYINGKVRFISIPTRSEQSYTKKKQNITRIMVPELINILRDWCDGKSVRAFIERPFLNPQGIKASISAARALEAMLIALEECGISYEYIDSKSWQHALLPAGLKGTAELKRASVDIACRLFPEHTEAIRKHKDGDSLLIAEWARRNQI